MEIAEKVTVSVIKADVCGFVGHSSMHPALIEEAKEKMESAKRGGR
jgi:fructose 1,6-bisphosphate aldolase/phosphatase